LNGRMKNPTQRSVRANDKMYMFEGVRRLLCVRIAITTRRFPETMKIIINDKGITVIKISHFGHRSGWVLFP